VVIVGHDDRPFAGADRMQVGKPEDPRREHDSGSVVVLEESRPLGGTRGEHDPRGPQADERRALRRCR
jgi:hypothetical protein